MTASLRRATLAEMNDPALFPSILCGTDNGPSGVAARRQAAWLAHPEGFVAMVPTRELTTHGPDALAARCEDHDLLVLGSEPEAHALIAQARIPVLLARWCPEGRDVTDEILVAVGAHSGAERAAALAARIAARHRGSISAVAAHGPSPELAHALAATNRIILCTAGSTPHVLGEMAPPEIAVPNAAAQIGASLLVIGVGEDAWDPALASDIARRLGCSMLAVPEPAPVVHRFSRAGSHRALLPA
jgi:hypothetical protein